MKKANQVLAVLVAATGMAAGQSNWPQFRGVGASGLGAGNPPVQWDAAKGTNVKWKVAIPGISVSSPIVWGDKVFVTTSVSSDPSAGFRHGLYGDVEPSKDTAKHAWKVYCLDRATGKTLWERTAVEGVPKTKRHPKSSQSSATPATDGKHLVAWFGSEGLYTYDLDGKLLWKLDLGAMNAGWFFDPDYEWGVASSPVIYKDMVILQSDIQQNSFLAAYRLSDGKQVWKVQREEIPSWGTPTVVKGPERDELVVHATKYIRGYNPANGEELWRLGPNSEITVPTPFEAGGLIYVTNGYQKIQPVYVIKPGAKGDLTLPQGKTSSDSIVWSMTRGGPYLPTPIVHDGILYIVSINGILTAYNAKSGERIYQQRLGAGGAYSASVVAAGGRLYFTSEDGEIHVVKAGPKFELLATNAMQEVCMSTPAIAAGDMLIVRTMKHVYGIAAPAQ